MKLVVNTTPLLFIYRQRRVVEIRRRFTAWNRRSSCRTW